MGTEKLWVNVVLKFLDNLYCSSLLFQHYHVKKIAKIK